MPFGFRSRRGKQPAQRHITCLQSTQAIDFTERLVMGAGQEQRSKTDVRTEETSSTVDNDQSRLNRTQKKLLKAKCTKNCHRV